MSQVDLAFSQTSGVTSPERNLLGSSKILETLQDSKINETTDEILISFKRSDTETQIKTLKTQKSLLVEQLTDSKKTGHGNITQLEEEVWDTMTKISELHHEIHEKPTHENCDHGIAGKLDCEQYYHKCVETEDKIEVIFTFSFIKVLL